MTSAHSVTDAGRTELEIFAVQEGFVAGSEVRGLQAQFARELFEELMSFGQRAFLKAHAVPYAMISYRTAFLKAHFPNEYGVALAQHSDS